jgi:hypothetical protein
MTSLITVPPETNDNKGVEIYQKPALTIFDYMLLPTDTLTNYTLQPKYLFTVPVHNFVRLENEQELAKRYPPIETKTNNFTYSIRTSNTENIEVYLNRVRMSFNIKSTCLRQLYLIEAFLQYMSWNIPSFEQIMKFEMLRNMVTDDFGHLVNYQLETVRQSQSPNQIAVVDYIPTQITFKQWLNKISSKSHISEVRYPSVIEGDKVFKGLSGILLDLMNMYFDTYVPSEIKNQEMVVVTKKSIPNNYNPNILSRAYNKPTVYMRRSVILLPYKINWRWIGDIYKEEVIEYVTSDQYQDVILIPILC